MFLEEINMTKESSLDSPRPASMLASFIPSSLQETSESGEDNNSVFSNGEDNKTQKSPSADLKAKVELHVHLLSICLFQHGHCVHVNCNR